MRRFFSPGITGPLLFLTASISLAEEELMLPGQKGTEEMVTEIQDIYGPVPLPESISLFLPLFLVILVLLLISLFFFLKRKKKKVEQVTPPHVFALAELDRARKFMEEGKSLLYAAEASSILRDYIERRFKIHSTRQTTSEFLGSIQSGSSEESSFLQPHRESLQTCLERCDMAKYACMHSERNVLEEMESSIRVFINETQAEEQS